jgi:hypothetical protein
VQTADPPVLRSITRQYHNSDYYSKGRLTSERLADGQGRAYTESRHSYRLRDIDSGGEVPAGGAGAASYRGWARFMVAGETIQTASKMR